MTTTRSTATGLFASVFPTLAGRTVHGNGRRGGPEFRIDAAELAAWNAKGASARADYATHLCPFCGGSQVGMSLNVAEMHRRACQRKAAGK